MYRSRTTPADCARSDADAMTLPYLRSSNSEDGMLDSTKPPRPPLVLIANDQEWSARSLESILGPHGYAVLRAYTGRQAMELARSAQPDAVILEAGMPDIAGTEICRILLEVDCCSV